MTTTKITTRFSQKAKWIKWLFKANIILFFLFGLAYFSIGLALDTNFFQKDLANKYGQVKGVSLGVVVSNSLIPEENNGTDEADNNHKKTRIVSIGSENQTIDQTEQVGRGPETGEQNYTQPQPKNLETGTQRQSTETRELQMNFWERLVSDAGWLAILLFVSLLIFLLLLFMEHYLAEDAQAQITEQIFGERGFLGKRKEANR